MEQHTPYEPLRRAPLKLSGVFGMAWQLYKRGFWPLFAFLLILTGIISLPNILLGLAQGELQAAAKAISFAIAALSFFLVAPAQNAVVFMELEERIAGRSGTLSQLFRYALPIGLKRFYSTYFAMLLVSMGVAMIMMIILFFILFIVWVPVGLSMLTTLTPDLFASGTVPPGFIGIAVFAGVLLLLLYTVLGALTALIFPAAVHEGRRSFKTVSRGMRLSFKRLGRMLIYGVLYSVYLIAIVWLPLMILRQNTGVVSSIIHIAVYLIGALLIPYWNALAYALYVDSAARVDAADAITATMPSRPQPQYYPDTQPQPYAQPQPEAQPKSEPQPPPYVQPQPNAQPQPGNWVDTDVKQQSDIQK